MTSDFRELVADLCNLDDLHLLCGPDGNVDRLVIDPIFAVQHDANLNDMFSDLGLGDSKSNTTEQWLAALVASAIPGDGVMITAIGTSGEEMFLVALSPDRSFSLGVIAVMPRTDGHDIVGAYTGSTLTVCAAERGRGLGRQLVMLRYLLDGCMPVWCHDKPSYSPGGVATHLSACRALLAMIRAQSEPDATNVTPEI